VSLQVSTEALEFDTGLWLGERRAYIRCRTIGHSWFDYDSNWTPQFGTPLTLRCERCGTERRDTINTWGDLLARHYTKPENYDRKKDEQALTRSDFRVLLMSIRAQEAKPGGKRKVAG
jgi:hypothetical protein